MRRNYLQIITKSNVTPTRYHSFLKNRRFALRYKNEFEMAEKIDFSRAFDFTASSINSTYLMKTLVSKIL